MKINLDFGGIKKPPAPPPEEDEDYIPPIGWYDAKLIGVEHKTSSPSRHREYLVWAFALQDVPQPTVVYDVTLLDEKTMWKLKDLLHVLTGLRIGGVVQMDTDKLIGRTIKVRITHFHYGDKTKPDIAEVAP